MTEENWQATSKIIKKNSRIKGSASTYVFSIVFFRLLLVKFDILKISFSN